MRRLFAILCVVILPAAAAGAQALFRSNELGMEIAAISTREAATEQWVLSVQRKGAVVVRMLTDHGSEFMRWEETYVGARLATESVFEKGELSSITDYRNGHPVRQVDYRGGKESLVRDYSYSGGLLRSVTVTNGSGKVEYRDLYSEGADGRLRRAVRELPNGERSVISFNFAGGRLVSEWLGTNGDGTLQRYSEGSLVARERWTGPKLTREEELSSSPAGSSSVTTDFQTGEVTKKLYGSGGKILSERVEDKGSLVRLVDYAYAGGHLAAIVTKSPGRREEVRYEYDAKGDLLTTETTVNRELVKVTHYTGKNSYFEDLYLNGHVVVHVFYENGKKVKEVPASGGGGSGG